MNQNHSAHPFSPDFVWGVATSAYQIEGAANEDGRGDSVWDVFCRKPSVIADGSHGEIACDHYRRWGEDLDLVASLGVNAYRFSISWPRVQPDGVGAWNTAGLDFYDRLVDGMLERGLMPYMTLNHWDLPQALQEAGGWANRDCVDRFVDYAQTMTDRLGDRVVSIATHNEPWVVAMLGHESGIFAPGIKDLSVAMQVSHHLLLSHGRVVQALRASAYKGELGIVLNLSPTFPASQSPEDVAAARLADGRLLRWYMDPLYKGRYPLDVIDSLGKAAPDIRPGDMDIIAEPIDFLGINYYTRSVVAADGSDATVNSGLARTSMGWEVYPEGLTELLVRLHKDYAPLRMYVTENGGAFPDTLAGGAVHDADRIDYLARHISAVSEACRQGANVAGYMVWSLLDNFEWASGYSKRFGLFYVDYATQRRIAKDSAHWYRNFLSEQRRLANLQPTLLEV